VLEKKENKSVIPVGVKRIETLRYAMEEAVKRGIMEEFKPPVDHLFCSGLYARRNYVKAGVTVVTKVHAKEHVCIVLYGKCHVYDQDGKRKIVQGPDMFITKPGTQRAIYCETDTSWINVHVSATDSVDVIEEEIFNDTFADYQHRLEYIEA
jgi:cupin superfamily acireductone dioxygenase involved in methionine salvage